MIASLNYLLGMSRTTDIPRKVYVFTRTFFYFQVVRNNYKKNRVVELKVVSVVVKRWIDNCSRPVLQNANLSFFSSFIMRFWEQEVYLIITWPQLITKEDALEANTDS